MTNIPNLYGFATKELSQDATIAYILAWADPSYRESHPRLYSFGTELLRSLLQTQEVDLPQIETHFIETQVNKIDIVVQINPGENGVLLIIEDKVSAQEGPYQIEGYKDAAKEKYSGKYDRLVAVYLKTGNESQASLPNESKCGRFMRRDFLGVLNRFQDTGNTIVYDFRTHLQGWEDDTTKWESASYVEWRCTYRSWEGFYAGIERRWGGDCGWNYVHLGDFYGCWLSTKYIEIENRHADLYIQIHDAMRLTVRLGSGTARDKVSSQFMYQVLDALNEEVSGGIRIEKAGTFRGGVTAAVANVTFDGKGPWFAVDRNGVVNMDATIERLRRLEELVKKVATRLTKERAVR